MDAHITAGTAILRTTEATLLGASVGVAGHRITTTPSAAAREAARLDLHPVAVARLEALREDHQLVVAHGHLVAALADHPPGHRLAAEAPGHPVVALVDQPHGRRLAAEARGQAVAALVGHHPHEHHSVVAPLARQPAVALAHPEPAAPARLDRLHHPVALAQPALRLAEAHRAPEAAHAQAAVVSSVGEVAAHVRVVASLEAVRAPVEAASLAVVAAAVAPVDLEAADDDRFSFCNRRRLGFDHAA